MKHNLSSLPIPKVFYSFAIKLAHIRSVPMTCSEGHYSTATELGQIRPFSMTHTVVLHPIPTTYTVVLRPVPMTRTVVRPHTAIYRPREEARDVNKPEISTEGRKTDLSLKTFRCLVSCPSNESVVSQESIHL